MPGPRRLLATCVTAWLVAAALAGCGQGVFTAEAPSTSAPASSGPDASGGATTTATGTPGATATDATTTDGPSPSGGATPSGATATSPTRTSSTGPEPFQTRTTTTRFSSPNRTVFCTLQMPGTVNCIVKQPKWTNDKPDAASCVVRTTGRALAMSNGVPLLVCTSVEPDVRSYSVLPAGHGFSVGTVVCNGASTGIGCADTKTGRGFTASQTAYSLTTAPGI